MTEIQGLVDPAIKLKVWYIGLLKRLCEPEDVVMLDKIKAELAERI